MAEKKNNNPVIKHVYLLTVKMYFAVILFAGIAGGRAGVINYGSAWSCEKSALGRVEIKKGGASISFGNEAKECPNAEINLDKFLTLDTTNKEKHRCSFQRKSQRFCTESNELECFTIEFQGLENPGGDQKTCLSLRKILEEMGGPRKPRIVHHMKPGGDRKPTQILAFLNPN